MIPLALLTDLALRVQPGCEIGVLFEDDGELHDVVVSSTQRADHPRSRISSVAILERGQLTFLMETTEMDSGRLIPRRKGPDILVVEK